MLLSKFSCKSILIGLAVGASLTVYAVYKSYNTYKSNSKYMNIEPKLPTSSIQSSINGGVGGESNCVNVYNNITMNNYWPTAQASRSLPTDTH
ncbi:unnamed protein product [Adineta ricciae]|uniref:Uncharacterized protein n=1 Tax=Adineta ricciae TaxID=249248 RepID=A0A815C9U8_ADIRI|nr:unnamed protein product [Adineta ricciae]